MAAPTAEALTETWNRAFAGAFPLRPELARQFLSIDVDPDASATAPAGMVVTKVDGDRAWLAALVVEPHAQGRRLGGRLVEHAVAALRRAGVREIRIGGDRLHLLPGVPDPGPLDFFRRLGFELETNSLMDARIQLSGWRAPAELPMATPAESWDPVVELLEREFGGRRLWEAEESRRRGVAPGEYLLMPIDGRAEGFVRIQHAGGEPAGLVIPAAYWTGLLDDRWGAIGPVGVAARLRGRGIGFGLVQAAMTRLQRLGVRDVVVDGIAMGGFSPRAEFAPLKRYRAGRLEL